MPDTRKGIHSVEIGLNVLNALARLGRPSSLTVIAKASQLSPSQTHRYLASLARMQYVRQDAVSSLYDLNAGGALRLGLAALARLDVVDEAGRAAQQLVEITGRTAQLAIWSEQGPTIIRWFPGRPPIYTSVSIGSRLSLIYSATGQVFLAFLDHHYLDDVLNSELALAPSTLDLDSVKAGIRASLIAEVEGTQIPGLRAAAAPVFDLQGQLALVLSVIASQTFPKSGDESAASHLVEATRAVTERIGGRWPGA